ncbi:hypothetical protein J3R30DRAFT_3463983 [Lentinula aciculospora]|uniref:Extracellular membrane protein CFEM domain-containing protein n=1 Tax=Lentinula aciculospora TaxID=153920 RepID=A0A9W9AEP4_9AGAR|nr:hypothetical protein J3R30DRAFT_3463983 [Lentinula aciculospora]
MLAFTSAFSLLFLLASQATAFTFNVSFGTQSLTASQILPNLTGVIAPCASTTATCSNVQSELSACQDDATCLCEAQLVADLRNCEQCMYETVINANAPAPDMAGSTPILAGYQAACAAFNITLNATQIALTLPANWDGPFGLGLNIVGTVFTVGAGSVLGISSLLLLSNL